MDSDRVIDLIQEEVITARERVADLRDLLITASVLDEASGMLPDRLDSYDGGLLANP